MAQNSNDEYILCGGTELPPLGGGQKTLGEIIYELLQQNAYNEVIIESATSTTKMTFSEIRRQSIDIAQCLRTFGICSGDVVSISSQNCAKFVVVCIASLFVGAIISPINPMHCQNDIDKILCTLTQPKIIFASNAALEKILKSSHKCPIILLENAEMDIQPNVIQFDIFMQTYETTNKTSFLCQPIVDVNDTALYIFTSGTTGIPKGIELTHRNVIAVITYENLLFNESIIVSPMPWFHIYGFMTFLSAFTTNSKYISIPMFEQETFLHTIEVYKANILLAIPPVVYFLAHNPMVKNYNLSSLNIIYSASSSLKIESIETLKERMDNIYLRQCYGMTEVSLISLYQNKDYCTSGSIGSLIPGYWGKIIDIDTGKTLGPNERGEMCFKGNIMKGYLKDGQLTKAVIDNEGWFHTDDMGYYTDNHEWFCIDRIKDIIRFKHYKVSPVEIECLLLKHSHVIDAAVVGIPDRLNGQMAVGFVVKQNNTETSDIDLINFVKGLGSYEKQLHGGIMFVDAIPKTQTGKILRRNLRELVQNNNNNKNSP